MKKVALIMGSASDEAVVKKAHQTLSDFGIETTTRVLSAHRAPFAVSEFARRAKEEGYGVIIAAAGMAAHLAGAIAANTALPVIAIPVKSDALGGFGGMDALLASVMMPPGVPVATVAVDGAVNAALLAVQILALSEEGLAVKLNDYKSEQRQKCLDADMLIRDKYNI